MPKDRRIRSLRFDPSRASPSSCSSSRDSKKLLHENPLDVGGSDDVVGADAKQSQSENPLELGCRSGDRKNPLELGFGSVEDVKEWEDARCPICMEHPHNAVLLRCSSFEKGCRPFMCNTSYRHSNCLDQFCRSSVSSPSTVTLQEIPLGSMGAGSDMQSKLMCPLCRGEIYGWSVVEPARQFMNLKARSCSSESCNFSGTYSELRKHARSDHPLVRPAEVDPDQQSDWIRLERERGYEDMLSSIQSVSLEESNGGSFSYIDNFPLLTYLAFVLDFMSHLRNTEQVQSRRRSGNRGSWYDRGSDRGARDHNSLLQDRAFLSHPTTPSPVERFQSRHHSSERMLRWRHPNSPSERVFFQGRRQSSQADRTRSRGSQGLRWRTPRWSTFNNRQ